MDCECERLSLDCECALKIPSLFGLNTRFCCVLTRTKSREMDWTGGYITGCFFLYGKCHFLKGMMWWICAFVKFVFFPPTSRVEEWEFGKMAEMIIMWGNQNE